MKKLEEILKIYLALHIIFTLSGKADGSNSSQKETDDVQDFNDVKDENLQLKNDDDDNAADSKKLEFNNEPKYSEVQEFKTIPEHKRNDIRPKNTVEKFKYAIGSKDVPGFDFTPEEIKKFKIWKDGVIPYYIDVVSFSDKVLRDKIRNFLQMVNSATNVNFVELPGPPTSDAERWVFFINRRGMLGCADHSVKNFTNQGVQQVVLGYDCIATRGEIAEAVMSIVGVPAQHNAPDRDEYIEVNLGNIMPDKQYLFEKINEDEWLFQDLAYDFNSVTHYDIHKYSANGRATIKPKITKSLNPATDFSPIDLQKIKMLYNFITKNKNIGTPVCQKLFKISDKYYESLKRFRPRPKPKPKPTARPRPTIPYDEILDNIPALPKDSSEEAENKNLNDENSNKSDAEKKGKINKLTYNREEGKKRLKARHKNKKMVDILQELSDYVSAEKVIVPLKKKIDHLQFSDY